MIDLVYPLGHGSIFHDNELRLSLKTLSRFGRGIDRVFIVGPVPRCNIPRDLRFSVIHVPAEDLNACKEKNIKDKLVRACGIDTLRDSFVMMNDDFFFREPVDFRYIPYYYRGTLREFIDYRQPNNDKYQESLVKTDKALLDRGLPTTFFDVHAPMRIEKAKFPAAMSQFDWSKKRGFVVKSLYCNVVSKISPIPVESIPDCKIDEPLDLDQIFSRVQGRAFFSVGDPGFNESMRCFIEGLCG